MIVIFDGARIGELQSYEIEDKNKRILEAVYYAGLIKNKEGAYPDFFFFNYSNIDNENDEAMYFINKQPVSKKDMQQINLEYADFMEARNFTQAILCTNDKNEIRYIYPYDENKDKIITIN